VLGRSATPAGGDTGVVEVVPGARIVLSAHAEGSPGQYPRLMLDVESGKPSTATPIAPAVATPATPSTPIVGVREDRGFAIAARTASGLQTIAVRAIDLPFSVGRSRSQKLVIDWTHEDVSGHHLEIVEIDEAGVTVIVRGDNGVVVGGAAYPAEARLIWKPGESMTLGRAIGGEAECRLTLSRTRP
jgi:hypothetical protein